jgi:hypothetical protein
MSAASWQLLFENMRCDVSVFEKYLKVRAREAALHSANRASGVSLFAFS